MQKQNVISIDYLENPARFADLLNGYVYHGEVRVQAGDIRELSSTVPRISKKKKGQQIQAQVVTADIVREMSVEMKAVIVALENQTDIHYAMPVRVMNLESSNYHTQWRRTAKQHAEKRDLNGAEYLSGFSKEDKLVPTITIVVYFGDEPWDGPISLKEMMDMEDYPPELQELIEDYHIHLLEVRKYKNLEHFHTDLKYVFGFLQKEKSKDELRKYVQENSAEFEHLCEDAYDMISVMSHSGELLEYKQENVSDKGGTNMCQAILEMIEDGRQEGREQGREQGIQQGMKVLVECCQEFGISKEDATLKVKEKYNLTEKQAKEKIALYWVDSTSAFGAEEN